MRVLLFLTFGFIVATLASESEEDRRWGWKPKYPKKEKDSKESMSEEEMVRPEVMPFPRPRPYPKPRPHPKPRPSRPITMYPRNFYYLFRHICRKGEIEFPTCERFEKIWIFATSCDEVNEGNFNGKLK